ncbi:MAG: hypothetical protein AAGB46_12570, partial [Verrucomicrobiota bacterium]
LVLSGDTTSGFQAIADGTDPGILEMEYPAAVGGVLNQHAWNLAWVGLVTIIGALYIWRGNVTAIWVTAMVGGLLDVGYFIFIDLGGFNRFMPGTVMTVVSALAIILSFRAWFLKRMRPSYPVLTFRFFQFFGARASASKLVIEGSLRSASLR